ncbi:MAG: serine/threonine-protein kinase [Planctomycetota bacterium]
MNDSSDQDFEATCAFDSNSPETSGFFGGVPPQVLGEGDRLGRFEIKRRLGVGGMGAVYLGFDPDLEREVAIKVLSETVSGDQAALTRFRSEAQAAGHLNHPNVVAVYEIGDESGNPYIVMEYVPNGSVTDLLVAKSPLDLVESTRIMVDASRGIAAAHAKGLIHRDIKPANLMVGSNGTIKVADFGLARARHRSGDANLTQQGQILGTPYFMSPEQCQGSDLDARSDLYSLGATFFMLLTGVSPYQHSGSAMAILASHINETPPDPKQLNAKVPAPCVRIIHRLLAKSPDDRYASAELLIDDLVALLKVLEDPNTATEVRYRGTIHQPREMFDLPSEVSGAMSRIVEPGGTTSKLPTLGDNSGPSENTPSRARSWLGRRSRAIDPVVENEASKTRSSSESGTAEMPVQPTSSDQATPTPVRKPSTEGYRKEVYSVEEGRFVLWWPEKISASEAKEVQDWLTMVGRKLERVAQEQTAGHVAAKSEPRGGAPSSRDP